MARLVLLLLDPRALTCEAKAAAFPAVDLIVSEAKDFNDPPSLENVDPEVIVDAGEADDEAVELGVNRPSEIAPPLSEGAFGQVGVVSVDSRMKK
jgi:hypothetical protein